MYKQSYELQYISLNSLKQIGYMYDVLIINEQAGNQFGIPGGAKRFLREAQIFWTMSNIFKLYPTQFFKGGRKFF